MKKLSLLLCAAMLLLFACQKDTSPSTANPTDAKLAAIEIRLAKALAEADALLNEKEDGADDRANVTLPAGSVNGLAAAIAAAGPGGKVTVASGNHYESGTVEITFPVKIVGQSGAVFYWDAPAADYDVPVTLLPALHVKNADDVTIRDIEINADAPAVCGILLENAENTLIKNNGLFEFQHAIWLADADGTKITGNVIGNTSNLDGSGIVAMDGNNVVISDNEIYQNAVGVFLSDEGGNVLRNTFHQTTVGILFCTVPADYALPSGAGIQAPESANLWLASKNEAYENVWGYLVIDGAFDNTLFKNSASNNALYDIELAGESLRFGFPTPTSSNSTVVSNGNLNGVIIKDCAPGSVIIGGTLVDTNADPCF